MNTALAKVKDRPKVFYELDATDPAKPFTAGANTFIDLLITQAGGANIGANLKDNYPQVSQEELLAQDPDIILLGDAAYGATPDQVAARPGWSIIKAVKKNQVFAVYYNLISRPGPRLVDGLATPAKLIHPEAFNEYYPHFPPLPGEYCAAHRRAVVQRWGGKCFYPAQHPAAGNFRPVDRSNPASHISPAFTTILFDLRLPRTILVAITGSALAASGAAYQGLFRNPLADPYLIGVASGAGLGAVIAMGIRWAYTGLGLMAVPLAAFSGALLTVFVVYMLARVGHTLPTTNLILAGVAVSSFATALTSFLMLNSTGELRRAIVWLLGGSTLSGWQPVIAILPYVLLGLGALLTTGHALNVPPVWG